MLLFRKFELKKKEIRVALQEIYGIGWLKSINICAKLGLSYPFFLENLNHYNYLILHLLLRCHVISDVNIKRKVTININRLKDTGSYRGKRHEYFLPVRGQRSRTNANTQRSKRYKSL